MRKTLPFACLLLAVCAASASAAEPRPTDGCVDLSPSHEGVRFGSNTLLVRDGDAHYRVGFGRSCPALSLASSVTITTDGQANRLCASGTKVVSKAGRCAVRSLETIDADTFNRYKRRR